MISDTQKSKLAQGITLFLLVLTAYFVVKFINEIKTGRYIGEQNTPSTISVSGSGDVSASPDIATVTFTAIGDAATTKDAQAKEADLVNKALAFIKTQKVDDKDVQTSNYNTQPKYDYGVGVICSVSYCPSRQPRIVGYTATQTVSVKIRNLDSVGDVLTGLGTAGITDISGPNFTIENEDALKDQARSAAITEARARADVLAKELGVRIVRVASFQESGNGGPIYYAKDMAVGASAPATAPTPGIPAGQNKITDDVTITYEIR